MFHDILLWFMMFYDVSQVLHVFHDVLGTMFNNVLCLASRATIGDRAAADCLRPQGSGQRHRDR